MALCPRNVGLVHGWLKDCETNHTDCKRPSTKKAFLPTRLLCIKVGQICLVETQNFTEEQRAAARFIALSHCWGPPGVIQYKTTTENILARLKSIAVDELPQTIKDAVAAGQALGIDYIWIDSICIVQDMPQDLKHELSIMLEVYSKAEFTISAACAASVEEGFLKRPSDSRPRLIIPGKCGTNNSGMIIFTEHQPDRSLTSMWRGQIHQSPWNQRAWTLQESLVTPRILHFGKDYIFFECSTQDCFEGADISREFSVTLYDPEHVRRSPNTFRPSYAVRRSEEIDIEQTYKNFYRSVAMYAKRRISFVHDKAVGFSSILLAGAFVTKSPARHGLLMDDLRRGLIWMTSDPNRPTKTLSQWPTWSWLSYDGMVAFVHTQNYTTPEQEKALSRLALDNQSFDMDLFQNIENHDKRLKLNAFVLTGVEMRPLDKTSFLRSYEIAMFYEEKWVGHAYFDTHHESYSLPISLLSLGFTESERIGLPVPHIQSSSYQGLLLIPNDGCSYKRVGYFKLHRSNGHSELDGRWIFNGISRTRITLL